MVDRERSVGVRELRQNLSVYLRHVAEGETLVVTERGRRVAVLAPLPEHATALDRLAASGRVTLPTAQLIQIGSPLPADRDGRPSLSDLLEEQRRERD